MLKIFMLGALLVFGLLKFELAAVEESTASPTDMLRQADTLREQGHTLKALSFYDQALDLFQKRQDYNGVVGALNGQFIAWKHRFYETLDPLYSYFVMQKAQAIKYVVDKHALKNRLPLVQYQLGNAYILFEQYVPAAQALAKAVDIYPSDNAEKGDWMAHHGYALYLSGKKPQGKAKILEGIEQIQSHASSTDAFHRDVWLSGAYRRLSELLEEDDPKSSQLYFKKAETIVNSNPALVIRSRQMELLKKEK